MLNAKPKKVPLITEPHGSGLGVLDLFSGCGGMSLGFLREGFQIVGSVEFDELAARSHALNFCRELPPSEFERHTAARDITRIDPDRLAEELGLIPHELDVIIGGPPCQSYARVGRAKLREVYEHPHAFKLDPQSNLNLCSSELALIH